jgi:tripartite-type tricarboxylate transporter receptor subunit TctC
MKSQKRIEDEGREAGFDSRKIAFLLENFTPPGHHHSPEQIDDLKAAVEDIVERADRQAELEEDEEDDEDDEDPEYTRYLDE